MRELGRRSTAALSDSLHHHLNMYTRAAAAAGVSLMALSPPAEGKVIYKKDGRNININHTVNLDLDGDGSIDFRFVDIWSNTSFGEYTFGILSVQPAGSENAIWGYGQNRRDYASALLAGHLVGPQAPLLNGDEYMASAVIDQFRSCFGPWVNVHHRYLGLRFTISGKTHYGWAQLDESCNPQDAVNKAVLNGYAYESEPNTPLFTGRVEQQVDWDIDGTEHGITLELAANKSWPASLGGLALGAQAISRWRPAAGSSTRSRRPSAAASGSE